MAASALVVLSPPLSLSLFPSPPVVVAGGCHCHPRPHLFAPVVCWCLFQAADEVVAAGDGFDVITADVLLLLPQQLKTTASRQTPPFQSP